MTSGEISAPIEQPANLSVCTADSPHHEDERGCCGKSGDGEIDIHENLIEFCALNAINGDLVPLADLRTNEKAAPSALEDAARPADVDRETKLICRIWERQPRSHKPVDFTTRRFFCYPQTKKPPPPIKEEAASF